MSGGMNNATKRAILRMKAQLAIVEPKSVGTDADSRYNEGASHGLKWAIWMLEDEWSKPVIDPVTGRVILNEIPDPLDILPVDLTTPPGSGSPSPSRSGS